MAKRGECIGQIFRGRVSFYPTERGIARKETLSLLKKKSCPGCDKCAWCTELDMHLMDEVVVWPEIEDQALYRLEGIWSPRSYEYPLEGDFEVEFHKIKDSNEKTNNMGKD